MTDPAEIAVARYAASVSWWALIVAVGSLCVAFVSLGVTFGMFLLELRRRSEEGVRLSMSMMVDAILLGDDQPDDNTYLAITVTNRGSAATTITNMVLYNYPNRLSLLFSKWPRFVRRWFKRRQNFVVNTARMPLPHVLEPGRNWHGMAVHTPELELMIKGGRLFVGVVGSHSDKPLLRRVRRWLPAKDAKTA